MKTKTELNDFVAKNDVYIISIETTKEKYDTGLPMVKGGSFKTKKDVLKLWYKEKGERTITVLTDEGFVTVKQMANE